MGLSSSDSNTTNEAHARHALNKTSGMGSGAEQDRYGQHFGIGEEGINRMKTSALEMKGSGAEQDRYAMHFGLDGDKVKAAAQHLIHAKSSGAEQDRYASHFGLGADGWARARHMANAQGGGSGAEQERYGSHWSGSLDRSIDKGIDKIERAGRAAEHELKR